MVEVDSLFTDFFLQLCKVPLFGVYLVAAPEDGSHLPVHAS